MVHHSSKNGLAEKYADFVLKFRWPLIWLLLAATVVGAYYIPQLNIRNDPDTLLPEANRYVATNLYAEHKFGMGNLMVFSLGVKEGDIYQPWFVNLVQDLHRRLEKLDHSRPANFLSFAAQKVKYMSADENGLIFKRLIPTEGISASDATLAKEQLDFLKEGIKTNPIMAPMLVAMYDAKGERCAYEDYGQDSCVAKAAYIIADYDDAVKDIYLPWVRQVRAIMDEVGADDRVELLVAGEPYFLAWMLADLVDKWWLFAISILIVVVVLWLEFRNWRGAIFPLVGVFMTIIYTLGLMGFTQYKLTTMMVLTPMLLLAIGIGHSVQIVRRFLLEYGQSDDCEFAARESIAHTIMPATLSAIAEMVGFATLATVDISFYKDYAYFGMFGMLMLLITTTTLIPLLLTKFPPPKSICHAGGHAWEAKAGGLMTAIVEGPGKIVPMLVVVVVMAASFYYSNFMNWRGDPEAQVRLEKEGDIMPGIEKGINYARAAFKGSSQIWIDLEKLNKVMPGVISVSIPIRGKEANLPKCTSVGKSFNPAIADEEDYKKKAEMCGKEKVAKGCWDADVCDAQGIFNNADVLADIEAMENWMRAHRFIGYTGSYAQYVRLVNMLMSAEPGEKPHVKDLAIPSEKFLKSINPDDPRNPDGIVQLYNGLLELMTSSGDMDSFVARDWNEGVILGFINTMDPKETHQVTMDIQQYIEEHKNDTGFRHVNFGLRSGPVDNLEGDSNELSQEGFGYVRPAVGGFLGATEATREIAMEHWLKGPLLTASALFIVLAIIFRSFQVALILIFTMFATLFAQYGLGGYFTSVQNWSGNLAFHLLVTLSIAMGLGVDYGIYMFSRLREEMAASGGDWASSLRKTMDTTGSAVIVSVIVLLGSFIPLVATDLANTWGLGIYIGEALIIDVFTALLLLPLFVKWVKPKYVYGPY